MKNHHHQKTKTTLESTKKILHAQRQRSHSEMAGRRSHNKPNSIASGWATQKLGNSLSRETLPRRPSLGLWRWEAEPPENPALRASRCDCRNSRQAGETETLLLKGTHEDLCIPGPGGRSSGLGGDWHCTASCGGWGGAVCGEHVSEAHCGDKGSGSSKSGKCPLV